MENNFSIERKRIEKMKEIVKIKLSDIDSFENHPFKVIKDDSLNELITSIRENGLLNPLVVRRKANNRFEMLSGHRRKLALELNGVEEADCFIKDLDDDEAIIYMVDSNIYRSKILPSEKGFAYKMKLDAMKHQGTRNDLTSNPLEGKLETAEIIGNENNESASNIRRYIRLTYLIPELLELVNEKRIAFRPAVELSFLKKDEQKILFDIIQCMDCTPSLAQAIDMKKKSQINILTADEIDDIMSTEKANQIPKLKINQERFEKVIPNKYVTAQQKEDYLYKCAEFVMKRKIKKLQQQQTR